LDAWLACARRTAVANVNVIVVIVLDRRAFVPFCSSVPTLHHTTTSPPATATRPPARRHQHPTPTNPEDCPPSSSLSHSVDTPTSLPPLLLTPDHRCTHAHLKSNESWKYCPGQRHGLLLLMKSHHGAYQPSCQFDQPTATRSPARHGHSLRLVRKPCEIRR